ncbi:hypothetical protein [Streptomyces albireticuli]|uniref:Uncharacterized protein n=1 Tax=Streptomyces albireticuli TaxID=1940 RepID=A0A2A2D691_9ACTN|nr:hypothetical protein [Streptomyces albireticuli]MCD9145903.1 hypothetical protein [Streptomyces albireticuli]MCD9166073.1 hypothetical protein [Streptomyces albireticuli]MCD9196353.1 hypothetical protein [Streptomyces albireticuli]PAU47973.1 hypothetical protein CK936_15805 [Streptomyces albireticuli]
MTTMTIAPATTETAAELVAEIADAAHDLYEDATHVEFVLTPGYAPDVCGIERIDDGVGGAARYVSARFRPMSFQAERHLAEYIADTFALLYEQHPDYEGTEATPFALRLDLRPLPAGL